MKKLFVLLLVLSLAVCLGVTALAIEEGGEFPAADGVDVEPAYKLSVVDVDFGTVTYKLYHTAKPLTIISSGNHDATITGFEVSGDFETYATGDNVITAGSTNTSWMIRPKAGLTVADSPYTGTVTITYNNGATATAGLYVSIEKAEAPIYSSTAPLSIDYKQETIHVVRNDDAIEPLYAINSRVEDDEALGTQIENGGSITDYIGTKIYYTVVESDNYKAATWWRSRSIPARPEAPTGPKKQADESIEGYCDGSITGLDSTMEYKLQGAESWTPAPENASQITGLASGTYLVRYKATDRAFASEALEITLAALQPATYTLSAADVDFGTVAYDPDAYEAKTLTITSSGNSDAAITDVSCTGPFEVAVPGNSTVTAGGTDTSWAIRPKAGTGASSTACTGTVTITYNNGATATADLTVTIQAAEQAAPEHHTLIAPWGTDWIAYEKQESSYGAPIEYSFDGGQTWITGTPDPEDPNRMVISGLTPDTHYSVEFRYGPSPDGNYMASAAAELTYSVGFTTMHEVKITQGDGSVFYLGDSEGLTFVSSDKFEDFNYLYVYPKGADMSTVWPLDAENFCAEEGSVRILLKAEYLNSLPVGEYVVEIPCTSRLGEGEAIASFFVKEAPVSSGGSSDDGVVKTGGSSDDGVVKTGDSRQAGLWAALILVCGGALALSLVAGKRKKH